MTDDRDTAAIERHADMPQIPDTGWERVPLPGPLYRERHKMPRAQTWRMYLCFLGGAVVTLALAITMTALKGPQAWENTRALLFGWAATVLLALPIGAILKRAETVAWEREVDRKVAERKLRAKGMTLDGHDPRARFW